MQWPVIEDLFLRITSG